jgi:hypothetical protein
MSVVVWDGKTLAADRQCMGGGITRICAPKIGKLAVDPPDYIQDLLWAYTGLVSEGEELLDWLTKFGPDPEYFPERLRNKEHCETILVTIDRVGTVREYANSPFAVAYPRCDRYAGGSGADFALCALHLNCNAVDAVRVTNELSVECGGGVVWTSFDAEVWLMELS